jgi:hypothetical protein
LIVDLIDLHHQPTTMTERSARQIWDTVVQVTNCVGTEEAKAIRVLVYLLLISDEGSSLWDQMRCRFNFYRRLSGLNGKRLSRATKGLPLFAFLYDTPANSNNLVPVFRAARNRGWRLSVLAGERFKMEGKGVEPAHLATVKELIARATSKERLVAIAAARKQFNAVSQEFERSSRDLTSKLRKGRAEVISELALAMIATNGLRDLYSVWQPNCVISTSNLWPFDCAVFDEARRLHIPSFVIQHGVTNHYWWPFVADKMLLWGKSFERELRDFGAPANKLLVCGMPAADLLFSRYQRNPISRSHKKLSSIVVLSHTHARDGNPALYSKFHSFIESVLTAKPSIQWSVKLHPNEDDSFYRGIVANHSPNFKILPKSVSLEEAVGGADVACTLFSTSGLEAMIMRCPLVVLGLAPIIHDYAWWPKFGGGTYVHNCEEMMNFINRTNVDNTFLKDQVHRQDGFLLDNFANHGSASEVILNSVENEIGNLN